MLYLIDGHNLIPYIPGLSLREIDDEKRLLDFLVEHKKGIKGVFEVFFDGAKPGFSGRKKIAGLVVHFVKEGRTADEAIRLRLGQLPQGSGITVISSDRQVKAESLSRRAKVIESMEFARLLLIDRNYGNENSKGKTTMSSEELADWMTLFGENLIQDDHS